MKTRTTEPTVRRSQNSSRSTLCRNSENVRPVGPFVLGFYLVLALCGWNNSASGQQIPPSVLSPVRDKTRHEGETVIFKVSTQGTPPLTYQWQFNGTNVSGATDSTLTLTNLQTNDAGNYSVVITNDAGSISGAATLTVLPAWHLGSVIVWGKTNNPAPLGNSGIIQVSAGNEFILALKSDRSVIAWGDNTQGQTDIPSDLSSNILAIAAGESHGLSVKFDGSVRGWGRNYNGQATPPPGLANVEAVAGGGSFSIALKDDGTVVAWGSGYAGATAVPAGLSNVVAIATGDAHAIALRNDGTVVGWGYNEYGQASGPSQLSNIVAVAAGHVNTMLLKSDGTVAVFGPNFGGETNVPPSVTNIVAIATTYQRCVALRQDGTVICWGHDNYGQSTPPPGLTNLVGISVGSETGDHTVAIQKNGVLILSQPKSTNLLAGNSVTFSTQASGVSQLAYQWQFNGIDLLSATNSTLTLTNIQPPDDGTYRVLISSSEGICTSAPAKLTVFYPPTITNSPQSRTVLAGSNVTFSVTAVGTTPLSYSWQTNAVKVSGASSSNLVLLNVQFTNVVTIRAIVTNAYGSTSSLPAILTVNHPPTIKTNPVSKIAILTSNVTFSSVVAGTLPLRYQWLFNDVDVVGATNSSLILTNVQMTNAGSYSLLVTNNYGTNTSAAATLNVFPLFPTILAHPFSQEVQVGKNATLTVSAIGAQPLSYVWQFNGAPIANATNSSLTLTNLQTSRAGDYTVIVSNVYDTVISHLAVISVAPLPNVIAWGVNGSGQTNVPSALTNAVAIAAGLSHALAVRTDGTVISWGLNDSGQLNVPVELNDAVAVAAGNYHSLALRNNGTVVGWGGVGHNFGQTTPPTNLSNVVAIASGNYHGLALKNDGTVVSWGFNQYGQSTTPAGLSNVVAIAGSYDHSLALKNDGTIVVWGSYYGETAGITNVVSISGNSFHFLLLKNNGTILGWGNKTQEGPTNAIAVASGWFASSGTPHNLAILSDRTVYGWGPNTYGQTNSPSNLSNVVAVAAGNAFSLALIRTPQIMNHPTNRTILAGEDVAFTVDTFSIDPVTYQWQFNGTNIDNATNSILVLESVNASGAGLYSVRVSNAYGTIVSYPAALVVASLSLSLNLANNSVSITWPNPFVLQSSTNVQGPYIDVTGYSGFYTNDISSSQQKYFRLQRP